jgi:hypothetical protein
MEKNTVLLDIQEYNQLRDFQKSIQDGKTYYLSYTSGTGGYQYTTNYTFFTKEQVVELYEKQIEKLHKQLDEQRGTIVNLINPKKQEVTIEDIKKMSVFNLIIWKIKNG